MEDVVGLKTVALFWGKPVAFDLKLVRGIRYIFYVYQTPCVKDACPVCGPSLLAAQDEMKKRLWAEIILFAAETLEVSPKKITRLTRYTSSSMQVSLKLLS